MQETLTSKRAKSSFDGTTLYALGNVHAKRSSTSKYLEMSPALYQQVLAPIGDLSTTLPALEKKASEHGILGHVRKKFHAKNTM